MVDRLFSFMTVIGSFIFLGVVGTLLYSVLFQRAAKYDASDGPPIEGNVTLEVVWTAIPILLVIWIAAFSYQTYHQMSILGPIKTQAKVAMAEEAIATDASFSGDAVDALAEPQPPMEMSPIEVRSRQWSWEFYYPDANVSSTELHLPVNQRAKFKLTSEDVLHALYVPAFRVKQDIVPGKVIDFSFTPIKVGRYRLRDSEYSGTYFASNQTYVVVETQEDHQKWLRMAAKNPLKPAPNQASEEYKVVSQRTTGYRYESVQPSPAPLVNYSAALNQ